jgi:O-antigen ligase
VLHNKKEVLGLFFIVRYLYSPYTTTKIGITMLRFIIKPLIFATFIGLICLSPSLNLIPHILVSTSFHDSQRLLELLLIGLVLSYSTIHSRASNHNAAHYAIYILIALAITSAYLAQSPRHALTEISLFAGLSYLTLFVMNLYLNDDTRLIKQLVFVFWASIIFCMVSFYTGYITALIFNTPVTWPAPLKGFSSIRSFNQYQLWTLGLITLPLLAFDFKRNSTRALLHIGLVAWWCLMFFAASRGVLLAWAVSIIITGIIYKKTSWPFIRLQLISITTGLLSYQVLFQLIPNLKNSAVVTGTILRDTTSDRLELWKLSTELIQNNPIFGVGPMHFAWASMTVAHPHNSILQLMAEWGLPAAIIILSLAGYGLFYWKKKFNSETLNTQTNLNQQLIIALFFTAITSMVYSLVDGVIVMPISQVMMFTTIGLMMGLYRKANTGTLHSKPIFIRFFAGVVLIVLAWSTLPEIMQAIAGSEKHFSIGYPAAGPRMWLEVK